MGYTQRLTWETLRSVDSATLTGIYVKLGTPLVNPSALLKIINNSTVLVTVSIDGVTDIDVAPSGSFWLYDESKTRNLESVPAGTQFWIKGAAGTGSVYLVTQYIIIN
jgi:hypothetical protein